MSLESYGKKIYYYYYFIFLMGGGIKGVKRGWRGGMVTCRSQGVTGKLQGPMWVSHGGHRVLQGA